MEVAPGIHRIEGRFAGRYLFQHLLVGARLLLVDTGVAATPEELILRTSRASDAAPARSTTSSARTRTPTTSVATALCAGTRRTAGFSRTRSTCTGSRTRTRWWPSATTASARITASGTHPRTWPRPRALCGDPVPVDVALTGGEGIALAPGWRVEVLHTPGHSEGHLSVWDPRSRTLIIADAAMGRALPFVHGEPALAATYTHPGPYAATNRLLRERHAELLLTAYFPAMRADEIERFRDDSAGLVSDIDRTLLDALAGATAPLGLRDLVDAVDTALGPLPAETKSTWAFPVARHPNELEAVGRVAAGRDGDGIVWTATDRSGHAT